MSNKRRKDALGKGVKEIPDFDDNKTSSMPHYRPSDKKTTAPNEPKIVASMAGDIALIPIGHIEPNKSQPRTDFDEDSIKALAKSIEELGIIQPITVRRLSALKYQIISGERRFRASQHAGFSEIPAYIRTADDKQLLQMGLVENVQREDLHPIEIATSYKRLQEECDLSHDEISKLVGKGRSSISNQIRLLELPEEIQLEIGNKNITSGHAKALLSIKGNKYKQLKVMNIIISQELSVREAEELCSNSFKRRLISLGLSDKEAEELCSIIIDQGLIVREVEELCSIIIDKGLSVREAVELCSKDSGKRRVKSKKAKTALNNEEINARDTLRLRYGKVEIKRVGDDGGKVELHYKNQEELLELLSKL